MATMKAGRIDFGAREFRVKEVPILEQAQEAIRQLGAPPDPSRPS